MSYSPAADLIGLPRLGEKFTAPNDFENDEQLWQLEDLNGLNNEFNFRSEQ